MNARTHRLQGMLIVALPLAVVLGIASSYAGGAGKEARTLRLSISRALFRDTPEPVVLAAMEPLAQVLAHSTGMKGTLVVAEDGADLAQKLQEDVDIGVFDGVEFAWARQHQDGLEALAIAINDQKSVRAFVITRAGEFDDFAKLKGKKLAMPKNARPHCHLFLAQHCAGKPEAFLGELSEAATAEDMLDDLVDRKIDAVLIDNASFVCYQKRKPARARQLEVLSASIEFPSAVVACRTDTIERATLTKIQRALADLDDTPLGKPLLTFWKLSSFEKAPAELDASLQRVAKQYPAPKTYGKKPR